MKEYVIETKQLTKSYGSVHALDHVTIHVERGSIYGLIGDNGAGKSTLLKLLAGHIFASSGEIHLLGKYEKKELDLCRRQMGAIIEQPGFFPNMTVENMMEYYRIQKGIPGKRKVEEILRLTGIWEKHNSKCKDLSLGMKQRLGLAIAMIGEPQLLLLDEPINGLDPSGIVEFRNLFHRLCEEKNITIILSSHILSELQQTAFTYGFLSEGRLLAEISAEKLSGICTDFLEIAVSDAEEYAALLDQLCPEASYRVLADQTIQIKNPGKAPEAYSCLAADHHLSIKRLERRQATLEDYYMNLKKGGAELC